MQLLGSLSFLTLFTPNLYSPVPLLSPSWSVLAHGTAWHSCRYGVRVCLPCSRLGGLEWLRAASRQRGAGICCSPPLWRVRGSSAVLTEYSGFCLSLWLLSVSRG